MVYSDKGQEKRLNLRVFFVFFFLILSTSMLKSIAQRGELPKMAALVLTSGTSRKK